MINPTRREWLAATPAALSLSALALSNASAHNIDRPADEPFGYCLNTSTIMGQKLPLAEIVEIAAKAGYHAIEPWIGELEAHEKAGKSLADLGKKIKDLGLTVESAIGFAEWAVDDEAKRMKGLEQMRRDMAKVRALGGTRIAAPPSGATDQTDLDLRKVAERYRKILEIGDTIGVVPQVEVWGFSKSLNRLGEVAMVAIESGSASACILADVYHLYRGGSDFAGVTLLNGNALKVLHMNDYPASPPRAEITDAQRVYPGDGVAPLGKLLRDLQSIGFRGYLSLEVFNRDYWKQDALTVARTGLEKMRTSVKAAMHK
ncbi:MAG: sugar phosphate isomerase/epimerase [Planctomycetota bacterium]|nr:sugar phosphate isomerase/epimerase [Planctomycetota bacterium]